MKGRTKMEKIRFLIKSKLEDYNDKAIKNKYNRSIDKSYLKSLPRRNNDKNLTRFPVMHSMLQDNDIMRCLISTNGKPTVNTYNKQNHISLDMSLRDYKLLPIVTINE